MSCHPSSTPPAPGILVPGRSLTSGPQRWVSVGLGSLLLLTLVLFLPLWPSAVAEPLGRSFYVDCAAGSDSYNGGSPALAWRTMSKANSASLLPGDSLLFKRGCIWNSRLDAAWQGTAAQPILIGAYGSGALPKIQNGSNQNVKISGSYQIIEFLQVRSDPPAVDPACNNQPYGWSIGFNFVGGAAYNTLRYSQASEHTAGVRINSTAHHNKILSNTLINNTVLQVLDPDPNSSDLGAWGMIINGSDNEIAYNYLSGNNAHCAYDFVYTGNSIELYGAVRTNIHHNTAINDKVFSELGGSAENRAADNTFAYNLHISSLPASRFLVVRGAGSSWGPTWRTAAYNNTVYFTNPTGQGVVCSAGCGPTILTLQNNIIWAEEKAAFADAPFIEANNLYWRSDGQPFVQFQGFAMNPTSQIAAPRFLDPGAQNLRLQPGSPAVNTGSPAAVVLGYTVDLGGTRVPQGGQVDLGAFELPAAPLSAIVLPARFEVEDYRGGGAGVGYHDTTPENRGGSYRGDAVDIQSTQDSTGTYNVAWADGGEWLAYDVTVATSGTYRFTLRVATPQTGRTLRLELDGNNLSNSIAVPNTSSWQSWTDLTTPPLSLPAGTHTLKLVAETGGVNLNYIIASTP